MRNIYVYRGYGSSDEAVDMLFQTLNAFCPNHKVEFISPDAIRKGEWSKSADLLAIGGGFDLGYIQALQNDGIENIRKYVEQGGSYLGICAGAYFACRRIEFDKGGTLEVCGSRQLQFFPGVCIGPVFPGFTYNSEAGAHAAHISTYFKETITQHELASFDGDVSAFMYYNGGGYFVADDDAADKDVSIIARYANSPDGCQHPSVVKCQVGNGTAVLSSVHFEYIVEKMNKQDLYLKDVIPKLLTTVGTRNKFVKRVLMILKLSKL